MLFHRLHVLNNPGKFRMVFNICDVDIEQKTLLEILVLLVLCVAQVGPDNPAQDEVVIPLRFGDRLIDVLDYDLRIAVLVVMGTDNPQRNV
jgi:hypothetical protein